MNPDDPTPYVKFIEGQLVTLGEEFYESFDWDTVEEDMIADGLDPSYISWVRTYPDNHPYTIRIEWS